MAVGCLLALYALCAVTESSSRGVFSVWGASVLYPNALDIVNTRPNVLKAPPQALRTS